MRDLGQLVDHPNAQFSRRFSRQMLDQFMHVGDPLADRATEALDDERELWSALVAHQTFPALFGEVYLRNMVDTIGELLDAKGRRKAFIRNLYLYLSGPEWFGVGSVGARDPLVGLLRASGFAAGSVRRWIPGASGFMVRRGIERLSAAEATLHSWKRRSAGVADPPGGTALPGDEWFPGSAASQLDGRTMAEN